MPESTLPGLTPFTDLPLLSLAGKTVLPIVQGGMGVGYFCTPFGGQRSGL
jgi:hypothetical protein